MSLRKNIEPNIATTSASIVYMIVTFALGRGMTCTELMEITGFSKLVLTNPENRVPDKIIHNLWKKLGELEPEKPLPLKLASEAPFDQLSHAFKHARNLKEAILFFCRHGKIASDRLTLEFREGSDSGLLSVKHPLDNLDQGRMAIFSLAHFKHIVDDIAFNPIKLNEFRCAYPAPSPPEDYQQYFGCPTYFDSSETALIFPRQSLEEPLRFANTEIYNFYNGHFGQILKTFGPSTHLNEFERLQAAIDENARIGVFDSSSAALAAHMSHRNAQRIAAKHNTSVKDLIREIRVSMAKEMVRNHSFDFEDIAEFLGYADESSFRRAFKTWTAKTPPAFRRGSHQS